MAVTVSQQIRKAITVDGVQKFEIEAEITNAGDLSDKYLFVMNVIDPEDAKADVFARVVTIADLAEMTTDRPTALETMVTGEDILYRISAITLYLNNLATAVSTQSVLKSRLDELVTDWELYESQFVTVSETIDHPQYNMDMFTLRVEAYSTALTAQGVAETARDDAKTDYDTAVTTAADAETEVQLAQTRSNDCLEAKGWFIDLNTAMQNPSAFYGQTETLRAAADTFLTAANVYYTAHPLLSGYQAYLDAAAAFVSAQGVFAPLQAIALTALGRATTNLADFETMCGLMADAVTAAQTAKTTADTDVGNKKTAYIDAEAAYEAAQQATEAALAAVRALKPDFDPATDIP